MKKLTDYLYEDTNTTVNDKLQQLTDKNLFYEIGKVIKNERPYSSNWKNINDILTSDNLLKAASLNALQEVSEMLAKRIDEVFKKYHDDIIYCIAVGEGWIEVEQYTKEFTEKDDKRIIFDRLNDLKRFVDDAVIERTYPESEWDEREREQWKERRAANQKRLKEAYLKYGKQ